MTNRDRSREPKEFDQYERPREGMEEDQGARERSKDEWWEATILLFDRSDGAAEHKHRAGAAAAAAQDRGVRSAPLSLLQPQPQLHCLGLGLCCCFAVVFRRGPRQKPKASLPLFLAASLYLLYTYCKCNRPRPIAAQQCERRAVIHGEKDEGCSLLGTLFVSSFFFLLHSPSSFLCPPPPEVPSTLACSETDCIDGALNPQKQRRPAA